MKTDDEIQKDVMEELRWEPLLNASEIGVSVHHAVVTLNGNVNTYAEKVAAEKATWRVKGVKAVAEELEVHLKGEASAPDAEIAEKIANTLKWNMSIPDETIKVKVTKGWVTLEGEVDWYFQKNLAANSIRYLKGVRGVSNMISVKPKVSTNIVKDNIRKALERNADLEANNISVEIVGDKVTLKGTTKSWVERRAVENAVWSAPGVAMVDDQLLIKY